MIGNAKEAERAAVPERRIVAWLLACLLVAALLLPLSRFVSSSAEWLPYPYPRAGSEGLILYESLLVKRGGDIYSPITPERFISGPYPPIYYGIAAWLLPDTLPDFGSANSVRSIFAPGRMVSLVASLLIALLIPIVMLFDGRFSLRDRRVLLLTVMGGAVGGVIFLTLPQTTVWATRFRGDMLMIAFTAAGLAAVAYGARAVRSVGDDATAHSKALSARQILALVFGAVFFALAFYTKQTALAGPAAAALFLLLRDRRLGLKWCGVMLLAVGIPFVALEIATGHWFYLKMVDYHSLPLRESTLTRLLQFAFLEDSWPLLVAAVPFAAYRGTLAIRARRTGGENGDRGSGMLIPIFLLTALVSLPTGAVVGADHNHLLMSGLAISLAVGAACAWAFTRLVEDAKSTLVHRSAAVSLLVALVMTYALFTSSPSSWYEPDLSLPTPTVQEQHRLIIQNVRNNPGTLFYTDDPGILALAGKETAYDDPFTMTALALQGRWDESYFREMLAGGQYPLLVLQCNVIEAPQACRSDTISPGVADSIRAGYTLLFRDILFTYAPRAGTED